MAIENTWNYDEYVEALKKGGDLGEQVQRLATQAPVMAQNAANLYNEIIAQQNAGSAEFWYAGNTAGKEYAAADFALRLAENGIGSLNELGQATVPGVDRPEEQVTINKVTGQPLPRPELLGRGTRGLDIDYNLAFTENGQVIPYTSNRESSWMSFRENALKPAAAFALTAFGAPLIGAAVAPGLAAATQGAIGGALAGAGSAALTGNDILTGAILGGAGGYFQGANAGFGPQTDASFLAADAAQLAGQGLSESTIAQVLGASGYASDAAASLAASMAVNGLDVSMMTQQLEALSTNTGLMSQTGSSADFLAADALQLQDQLGNNFAAIEQNLIASGVDPLVAADVSNQLAFNGTITQDVLATNLADSFGDNIYDVNVAETYPTSTLPGEGGLLTDIVNSDVVNTDVVSSDVVGTDLTTTTTTDTGGSTLGTTLGGLTTSQIADLLKAGVSLATILGASNVIGGGGAYTPMQTPTQGVPTNDPNYYNQLQQYYNAYLPQTPRDVVAPLQQWYEGSFGSTGTNTAVSPQQAQTAMPPAPSGTVMPTAPVRPVAPTPTPMPPAPTSVPMAASTGLFSTPMTAQQQVQNLLSSPNLSSLPPEAAAAISRAVSAPRSYNDVVASGGQNTVDVSSLSPEVQRAYDLYQQSMILGANSSEVRRAYERAGVNPTNPDAFFAGQGLLTGTPTQAALSQYAPLALDRFAKSGGGALTYTVDPSTLPSTYTAPAVPDITFNMDRYVQSINNNTKISDAAKQRLISEQAVKRGFNPSEFI